MENKVGSADVRDNGIKKILCLDGGGCRGLFLIKMIERIQENHPDFIESLDLIAGTSVGAVVGTALAQKDYEIDEIFSDLKKILKDIFGEKEDINLFRESGARYDSTVLRTAMERIFGKRKILRNCHKKVLITSTVMDTNSAQIYSSVSTPAMNIVDALMASTAAPTYFCPVEVNDIKMLDGGLWANNPAIAILKSAHSNLDNLKLMSIGTGYCNDQFAAIPGNPVLSYLADLSSTIKNGINNINMGFHLFDMITTINSDVTHEICRKILGSNAYLRLNPRMDTPIKLDDYDRSLSMLDKVDVIWNRYNEQIDLWINN